MLTFTVANKAVGVWTLLARLLLATTALPSGHRMPVRVRGPAGAAPAAAPTGDDEVLPPPAADTFFMDPATFKFLADYWVWCVKDLYTDTQLACYSHLLQCHVAPQLVTMHERGLSLGRYVIVPVLFVSNQGQRIDGGS